MRLLLSLTVTSLLVAASPAAAAAPSSAPVQVAPSSKPVQVKPGAAQPTAPAAGPQAGTGSIPLDSSPGPDPSVKANRDRDAAVLVVVSALLPILLFLGWRIFAKASSPQFKKKTIYYKGPADPRRMSRQGKRKKP